MKTFQGALSRGAFVTTAGISWMDNCSAADYVRRAADLAEHVDGIQLADIPPGQGEASPTAVAALLLRENIDITPTLNCRDRNRIALHSEILGMRALGVTSMVLVRGDENVTANAASDRFVFDADSRELITMARDIDETGLLLGTEARVPSAGTQWNPGALLDCSSAGARFLLLRTCFDVDRVSNHMARLVEEKVTWHFSVILSLSPAQQGIDACAQMIREASNIPGVSGVNLECRDDPGEVIASLQSSGVFPAA